MQLVLWDFDGTLAYRQGGMWVATLLDILGEFAPNLCVTAEQVRPYFQPGAYQPGFPWHTPEQPHAHIRSADEWWSALNPLFEHVFREVGVGIEYAKELAALMRVHYADPAQWRLFNDAMPILTQLSEQGFTHALLSNHVPELPELLETLELLPFFVYVFNSAQTGYEKPHPQAFQNVREAFPQANIVCMIGDNLHSDIAGAEAAAIPGILVRTNDASVRHCCKDLTTVPAVIQHILTE